jgi:hypothetical protein
MIYCPSSGALFLLVLRSRLKRILFGLDYRERAKEEFFVCRCLFLITKEAISPLQFR